MNIEELQNLWRGQNTPEPIAPRALELTVMNLQAEDRAFAREIWLRDVREAAASLVVSGFFAAIAVSAAGEGRTAWPLWTAAAIPLVVMGILFLDRMRHRHLRPANGDTLMGELERTLARLQHQEWLVCNVIWWYLLPLVAAIGIVGLDGVRETGAPIPVQFLLGGLMVALIGWVGRWVWGRNQDALNSTLRPRIAELQRERDSLSGARE